MLRRFFLMLILLVSFHTANSQKTAIYTEPDRTYRLGLELMDKQKYAAARQAFEEVVVSKEAVSEQARVNAAFYIGRCAAELYHGDAEFLLTDFINRYPESPMVDDASLALANYFYRLKKYKKAFEHYSKIEDFTLAPGEQAEFNFRMGYSAYMSDDYEAAARAFFAVKDGSSKYATAAQYFYAHMSYVNEKYETALTEFLKLRTSEAFGPVVPYYITQIYYKQGKYEEVLKYAPGALDSSGTRNGLEISRMIGESYYKTGNYAKALPYLTDYEHDAVEVTPSDYYSIAYCYFRQGRFEEAIPYFQKLTAANDSLAQNAFYHLGGCYLKTKAKRSARTSFQAASRMDFNKFIQEESRYSYAKLSYDLSDQVDAIDACRSFLKDFVESPHYGEINEVLINCYANTRNYKDALAALDAAKNMTPGMKASYQKVAYYRGVELFMDKNTADATRLFRRSLEYPVDQQLVAKANYWIGESEYREGHYAKAAADFLVFLNTPAAVSLPTYNQGNYNYGYAAFKQDQYAEALVAFRKYVKDKDQTDPDRYSDALVRIADCFFMTRDQVAALDYYGQAIAAGSKSADYACYQKGIILGVRGKLNEKAAVLEKLTASYPKSVYLDDAWYETGQAYLTMGSNDKALSCYRRVIAEFPGSSYVKKAELGEALVYYNSGKDDEAAAACKRIISKYPNTNESKEALVQLKNISVARHKVDEYLAFVKDVPNAQVSTAGEDSLVYEAAEVLYTQGNCEAAVRDFDNYLSRFKNAIYGVNANYYRSDCLNRSGKYADALPGFEFVLRAPKNAFTEKSLLAAAAIQFRLKQYEQAAQRFDELERSAEVKENIAAAQVGQLRSYDKLGKCEQSIIAADKVIAAAGIDKEMKAEARLIAARCYLKNGELQKAKNSFVELSKRTGSEVTAESKYSLALIEFRQSNYKESQRLIFEVQNQVPSYDFWIAKSFILLGDNYLALKDTFQARETYKSIVENFVKDPKDPEDLKDVALEKLNTLTNAQSVREKEMLEEKRRLSAPAADSLEITPIK